MCTSIVEVVSAEGHGRGADGWFPVTQAVVSYDHPHHALLEEAIVIDFLNTAMGPGARAAVELTLDAAKALQGALGRAIEAAEREESERHRG
jgi:Family of unknown function (DUF6295)